MAANSDFFVKFSSNATDFASQLERDLKPARAIMAQFQTALAGLEKRANTTGSKLQGALAKGVGTPPPAGGGGSEKLHPLSVESLQEAVRLQAQATNEVIADLKEVAGALELAKRAIRDIPAAVTAARRGVRAQDDRLDEISRGVGRDRDPVTGRLTRSGTGVAGGSPEDVIARALRRMDSQVAPAFGRTPVSVPPSSIGTVKRSDLDRANFDRIVAAIQQQTAALKGTGKGSGTGGGKSKSAQAVEDLGTGTEEAEQTTAQQLKQVEKDLKRAIKAVGEGADDATRAAIATLKAHRDALAAEVRKGERDATGVTRTEQSAQSKKAFAERPEITDVERNRRLEQQALINSPGAADFTSRLGRARTAAGGNYSEADLRRMVQAFRELGIAVEGVTAKTKKPQIAAALQQAHAQYERDFPEGHPDLETQGFRVTKTTQISSAFSDMVGEVEGYAHEIQQAREVIRADRRSGGTGEKPTSAEERVPGTIGATKDFAGNWRGSFGGAIGGAPGLFTPEQVKAAERVLQGNASRRMADAARQIGSADFDPFAVSARKEVTRGASDADRALAEAATSALRDLRLATDELDEFGRKAIQRSRDLRAAQAENDAFIERATARIGTKAEKSDDRSRLAQAETDIRPKLQREIAQLEANAGEFLTAEYQAGLAKRDASRAALAQAKEEMRARQLTTASYRDLHQATGSAVLGITSAPGSRALRRNIPGLGFNGESFTDVNAGGPGAVDPAQMKKINQAANKLTAAQWHYLKTIQSADSTEAEKTAATQKLEHAADTLARRVARNFNGIAPDVESLTGQKPTDPKVIAAEADRQAARDAAEAARTRKSEKTPEEAARTHAQALQRAQERVIAAREAEAKAAAKAAAAEEKFAAQSREARDKFTEADAHLDRLRRERSRLENPAIVAAGAPTSGSDVPAGDRAKIQEQIDAQRRRISAQRAAVTRATAKDDTAALVAAQRKLGQREQELRVLEQRLTTAQKSYASRTQTVSHEGAAPREPTDVLGYPSSLGYGEDAGAAKRRLDEEIKAAERQRKNTVPGVTTLDNTANAAAQAARELREAEKALEALAKKGAKTKGDAAAEGDALKRVTGATNARIAELLKERDALRAAGQYTKKQRAAAKEAGDTALVQEIDARRKQLGQVKAELRNLGGAAGGGTGGTPPTRTGGGGTGSEGGSNRSLLGQILSTLKGIHATLKSGLKVTGVKGVTTTSTGATTPKPRPTPTAAPGGATTGEVKEAQDLLRAQRLEAINAARAKGEARKSARDAEDAAKAQRKLAQESEKADRALREEARAAAQVDAIGRELSAETQREVVKLAELTQAANKAATAEEKLAAQKRIAAQQSRVAAGVQGDLAGHSYADRRTATSTILNAAGPQVKGGEVDQILRTLPSQGAAAGRATGEAMGHSAMDGFARVFGGGNTFWSRIMHTTGTFIVRNFAAGFVFGLTNVMQEITSQALQAEATFVRVSDALEATNKEVGDLRSGLTQMSSDYGVALNDTYTTAASLVGLFSNQQDLQAATRISTQLQTISNGALNADEAVGVLSSTMSAFNLEGVEGAQKIADVFTSIQNNLGVNIETTAEGVARMAGLAQQMKLSFEETSVFVAAIAKQTNQTGAAAGEQLSRMLGVLQTGRGREAIQENLGQDSKAFQAVQKNDYGTALVEMMKAWDGLTDSQKRNLGTTIAGQRQIASFNALMNSSEQNLRALTKAQNSNGDADARMENILKTLQSRVKQVVTAFQGLFDQLLQTGVLNSVGIVLVGIGDALQLINSVLAKMNELADSSPVLGLMRNIAFGVLGAVVAFKLLAATIRGLRGAFGDMRAAQGQFSSRVRQDAEEAERVRQASLANQGARPGGASPYLAGTGGAPARQPLPWNRGIITAGAVGLGRWAGVPDLRRQWENLRGGINGAASNLRRGGETGGRGMSTFGRTMLRWSDSMARRGRTNIFTGQSVTALASTRTPRDPGRISTFARQLLSGLGSTGQRMLTGLGGTGRQLLTGMGNVGRQLLTRAGAAGGRLGGFGSQVLGRSAFGQQILGATLTNTGRAMNTLGKTGRIAALGMNQAARGMAALGRGIKTVGTSGVAADLALVAVISTITLMANEARRAADSLNIAKKAIQETFHPEETAAQEAKLTPGTPDYIGDAYAQYAKDTEDFKSQTETTWGKISLGMQYAGHQIKEMFSNPVDFFGDAFSGNAQTPDQWDNRRMGLDDNGQQYGKSWTMGLENQLLGSLGGLDTAAEVQDALDSYRSELEQKSNEILSDPNLSDEQKTAALAAIQEADKYIQDQLNDRQAVIEGFKSGNRLTGQQIDTLLGTLTNLGQYNELGILSDPSVISDLQRRIRDSGVAQGSPAWNRLQKLLGPYGSTAQATTQFGIQVPASPSQLALGDISNLPVDVLRANQAPTGVDIARANVVLTRDALRSATGNLEDAQGDPDLIEDAQAKYDAAMGAYAQAISGLADALSSRADQTAQFRSATGDYDGALRAQVRAARGAERIFNKMNSGIIKAIRSTRQLLRHAQARANRIAERFGEDSPEAFNARGIEQGFRKDLRSLERMLHRTDAWRSHAAKQIARVHALLEGAIVKATADLNMKIAQATTDELRTELELQKAQIIAAITAAFDTGNIGGLDLPKGSRGIIKRYGNMAVSQEDRVNATQDLTSAQGAYDDAVKSAADADKQAADEAKQKAAEKRQLAADLKQAQLGVAAAAAEARGDAVAAARIQVAMAKAMIAAARADLAAATTEEESAQARIAILNAQAQLIAAHAAVQQAQSDLVQSQYDVSIALAEAAGKTVLAASRTLAQARAALRAALKKSHGKATAEVNQARAEAIRAEAALRDAKLQDDLDTIDFNLQMGRITQSSAIHALQEILRTRELTRDQRRQLLLQIKGMKEEMADSQWNIGDIKLPTPYQMRRYIEERRNQFRHDMDAAAGQGVLNDGGGPRNQERSVHTTTHQTNNFHINGADTAKVKKIIEQVVGGSASLHRTTGARRGG